MAKLTNQELGRPSILEYKQKKKMPLVLILDNIRSAHNVGSIFRTADAFLIEKIYLSGITASPPNREIRKTALGAEKSVCWECVESTLLLCNDLKLAQYKIVAVEQTDDSVFLGEFPFSSDEKYAFVFGHEVFGVANEVVELADQCLEIPQCGIKHSLNVAVSTGVVLWEFYRKIL